MNIRRFRALHAAGAGYAEIGRECGHDWRTIKKYLEQDGVATPPRAPARTGSQPRVITPFVELIDSWLRADVALKGSVIHERLVADYGFAGSYQRVKMHLVSARPRIAAELAERVENPLAGLHRRFEVVPGAQAQVDWGEEGLLVDGLGPVLGPAGLLCHTHRRLARPLAERTLRQLAINTELSDKGAWAPYFHNADQAFVRSEALLGRTDDYQRFLEWKYRDIQQYHLWHEDRTAALNGVEARVPFLDPRLLAVVASILRSMRAELLWDKRILREGLRERLPPDVCSRRKVSFYHGLGVEYAQVMIRRLLLQDDGALIEQAMTADGASEFLDCDSLLGIVRAPQRHPGAGRLEFALRAINLGLLQAMATSLPDLPATYRPRVAVCESVPPPDAAWATTRGLFADPTESADALEEDLSQDSVLSLAPGAAVLMDLATPDEVLLALDGELVFIVDGDERLLQIALRKLAERPQSMSELGVPSQPGARTALEIRLHECIYSGLVIAAPDAQHDRAELTP